MMCGYNLPYIPPRTHCPWDDDPPVTKEEALKQIEEDAYEDDEEYLSLSDEEQNAILEEQFECLYKLAYVEPESEEHYYVEA